ncbi:MAG: hypothetical protein AAGF11_48835 [Myxococcota bacterium]
MEYTADDQRQRIEDTALMCMFSGSARVIRHVGNTRIFAGARPDGRQVLVYSMRVAARRPVAMLLPLPVPPGIGDDALEFVDLKGYPNFFDALDSAFPSAFYPEMPRSRGLASAQVSLRPRLKVHAVGDFEASFVPTRGDFDRLDPRFRLSDSAWDDLPDYHDYGFAVFQLVDVAAGSWWRRWLGIAERKTIHPMAFSFPRRDPSSLFFPTLHVHDGQVHEYARFDHQLYAQLLPGQEPAPPPGSPTEQARVFEAMLPGDAPWQPSNNHLSQAVDVERARGIIERGRRGWKRTMRSSLPNEDIYLRSQPVAE